MLFYIIFYGLEGAGESCYKNIHAKRHHFKTSRTIGEIEFAEAENDLA